MVTMSLTDWGMETPHLAITKIKESIDLIRELRMRSDRHSDLDASEIRLLLRASDLEPMQWTTYMNQALKIARQVFQVSHRLTPEFADAVIKVFIEVTNREPDSETSDEPDLEQPYSEFVQQLDVSRQEILELDKILAKAEEELPSHRYLVLRLKLRNQYLATHWPVNSPDEPRMVEEAIQLASKVVSELSDDPDALQVVADLWGIIGRRTCREDRFNQAEQGASDVYARLFRLPRCPRKTVINHARFLRSMLDYEGSLLELKKYLVQEKWPQARYPAINLFLDVVAHSLHWSNFETANLDADAQQAVELYQEYLHYLGKELDGEDVSDRRVARRVLHWLRCRACVIPLDEGSLPWLRTVTEGLKVGAHYIENPDVLGQLSKNSDPMARIIGWHWSEPSSWREVGTWISATLGAEPQNRSQAIRFWRIAQVIQANAARWLGKREPAKQEDTITELNIARFLLTSAHGSPEWETGTETVRRLAASDRIPWVYRRWALQLSKEVHGTH